ncbi:MAG TPA: hypothetical protein VMF90_12425 [Rhizobiaceae bacterium]|nr:hypothetical protein [Rhizobiaceae bacterium]
MRAISSNNQAALEAKQLVARDFLWVEAREFVSRDPVSQGFWSGVGNVTAQVLNPLTGLSSERSWTGSGSLIQISDIPLVANGTVQSITIETSQLHAQVETVFRDYDCKQARIEVYRGLFDPTTRALVAPAFCRFFGFLDGDPITTPREGEGGKIELTAKSHTQEFIRSNPETRSQVSQIKRSATDIFYKDAGVVGDWEIFWNDKRGKVPKK